jgi:hypothetical protein
MWPFVSFKPESIRVLRQREREREREEFGEIKFEALHLLSSSSSSSSSLRENMKSLLL